MQNSVTSLTIYFSISGTFVHELLATIGPEMNCPNCESPQNKLQDITVSTTSVQREKLCLQCGLEFTTIEEFISDTFLVRKKDGRKERFNKEKLFNSLAHAAHKKHAVPDALTKLATEVEDHVVTQGNEIESRLLAEVVMNRLKRVDMVTYIRYAASYRAFVSADELLDDIRTTLDNVTYVPPEQPLLFDVDVVPNTESTNSKTVIRLQSS